MPLKDGASVEEARGVLSDFLQENGCYDICAKCPLYGEEGCCRGCGNLIRSEGCSTPNISCLTYTCTVLNKHLERIPDEGYGNKMSAFTDLAYGLPREGYRGLDRRPSEELLQITDPLEVRASVAPKKESVFTELDEV